MKTPLSILIRAVLTSGIVGTALTVVNQWAAVTGAMPFAVGQTVLTYLVPFIVSLIALHLAAGDTRQRPTGEQPSLCNEALENALDVLDQIEGNARGVNSASKARARALTELIETARDLQAALKGASADVEENKLRLKEARDGVREMDASTQRVLERLKNGHASSTELAEAVDALVDSARAVEAASSSISDISRKTELLAVNALIEASRAGEVGRGFAVVASQVGDLSARTNQVVTSISEKVESQRNGLDQAQSTLQQMLNHVGQSRTDSEGSIETAARVRTDVEGSASVAESIAGVMGSQATEFDTIVEFLVQVQKDTDAAVKGSATNISLAETAKRNVRSALDDTELPEGSVSDLARDRTSDAA